MKDVGPTILSPRQDATRILRDPPEDNKSIAEPILSPLSPYSDLDSFSVVSDTNAEGSQVPQLTNDTKVPTPTKVLDSPTNASDCLTSLVRRYHSLCHTIGTLRDDIKKKAEVMNEDALTKFISAKIRLETSRGKAREIVEGMRKTSDSRVNIRLPWVISEDGLVLLTHQNSYKVP